MELSEFRENFLKTAAVRATSESDFDHTAFVDYAGEQLSEAGEISDLEIAFFRGNGSRNRAMGVDAYAFDAADSSLRIVVADVTFAEVATTLTMSDAKPLISRAAAFVEDSISGRNLAAIEPSLPAWSLANDINKRSADLSRVRVYVVTDRVASARMPDWPEGMIGEIPVEAHIWDMSRFHRMAESAAGRDELVIDFESRLNGGLPCLMATGGGGEYQAYLLAVPGPVLADIYDEFGSRLLEGNVRSFLSTRPAVNKGIRNTAINQPNMFFAYNNGIAATASEVEVKSTPAGQLLLRARDLQIVNGGQTTASLATARRTEKKSLEGVFVPMKLSVVSSSKSEEMVPNIAKFANSQNKVSEADFFSTHEFHRRFEGFSRRLWAPAVAGSQHETHWFYERARGQYLNEQAPLTASRKRQFVEMNPRGQLVTKTDLAKAVMAWAGHPEVVSLGAQKNFLKFAEVISETWAKDDTQYHEGYYREAIAKVLIFRTTEKLVSDQPWYQGGYRANVVAYTVAKLPAMVASQASGMTVDLEALWKKQALPDVFERQLALVAKAMHDVITDPPGHVQNVTEWAKRVQCWDNAKAMRVELLPAFRSILVSKRDVQGTAVADRRTRRVDSGIEAQQAVLALGPQCWSRLRAWATSRDLLLTGEGFLLSLCDGSSSTSFPDERQAPRLLALLERMEGEGFPPCVAQ